MEGADRRLFGSRWASLLDDDTATLQTIYGARFSPFGGAMAHPAARPDGTKLSIAGSLLGLGPESDEARALLEAAIQAGLEPAARELPLTSSRRR